MWSRPFDSAITIKYRRLLIDFIIVDASSSYNGILGWVALNTLRANISTYFATVEVHLDQKWRVVTGDKQVGREFFIKRESWNFCPLSFLDQTTTKDFQPQGEFELLSISSAHAERKIKVGNILPTNVFQEIQNILFEYVDNFARKPHNLGAISHDIAKYHLGIPLESPPVVQKKRTFTRPRQFVIRENIQELLRAGIIKQVYYPKWLANPVIVSKHNGE